MKRKLLCLLVCICLLLCVFPAGDSDAASDVCFIAINDDTLLELTYMPYAYGDTLYVPYWVFTNYGFGINYSYFSESSTALLYSGTQKQIFFDLSNGNSYDGNGEFYSTQAVLRNGTVYLPVAFMCRYFGTASYSYITGSDYGDILRIKSPSVVLSDIQFQRAASITMQSRYNAYIGASPSPSPAIPPVQTAPPAEFEGSDICLSFIGLPEAAVLTTLKSRNVKACFFLTADEIRSDPDAVRRISGEGHSIGVLCRSDPLSEYEEASALLYEAARIKTLLVTATGEYEDLCRNTAEENLLVFWSYDLDAMHTDSSAFSPYAITSVLEARDSGTSVFMNSSTVNDESLLIILKYISLNKFRVYQPSETSIWEYWKFNKT